MNLVIQPKRSRVCGQAVVAMVLGINLDEAIARIGHHRGTKGEDLRRVLAASGITLGAPILTRYADLPAKAVVRLSRPAGKNWHWMLVWDGQVFDPANCYEKRLAKGWSITSFLPLELSERHQEAA